MVKKLGEISKLVGGELLGDADIEVHGVAGIKEAREGEITFVANPRYLSEIDRTQASAIIIGKGVQYNGKPIIQVDDPYWAFVKIVEAFSTKSLRRGKGVHPTAIIGENVEVGKDAWIQAYAFIGNNVQIGDGTVISPFVYVGDDTKIGAQTFIYPMVAIREEIRIGERVIIHSGTVIGSDGFGYRMVDGKHRKIPHIGIVIIEDDVEIGANCCVDRAKFGRTVVGRGTKVDNLVQIAHNVQIGKHCILVAQTGIAGSSELGDYVVMSAHSGIGDHVQIGNGVMLGPQAGITSNSKVESGAKLMGMPHRPFRTFYRELSLIQKLPQMAHEIKQLRKLIEKNAASKDHS